VYAEALKELAAIASPRLALAATDGDLLSRIRRVLGQPDTQVGHAARWVPIAIVVATIAVAVPATFVIAAPGARDQVRAREARLEPVRVTEQAPEGQAAQQSQAAEVEREQTQRTKAEYEALLREYAALLARYQSEGQSERIREAYERALASAPRVDDAYARALEQAARLNRRQEANAEEVVKQELERARAEIERAKKLFETGLISESQMKELEAKVRALSDQDATRHQVTERMLQERHRAEEAREQVLKHRAAEIEDLRRTVDEHMQRTARVRDMEIEEVKRALEAHGRASVAERAPARGMAPIEGPAAAGDLLEIRIANEPELPTHYEVRTDGTIRVPFLGSFKVVGQTAAQVQAAIGKQMSDRKLGSANQVTVSVMRRRSSVRRTPVSSR
jgi:tetratricopeptide (TPR) repeat protein